MSTEFDSSFDPSSVHLAQLCAGAAVSSDAAFDWPAIFRRAMRHRVVPLLYANLRERSDLCVTDETKIALRSFVQTNAARSLALAGQMRNLLEAFLAADIPVIVFKGIALSAALYDDVSMREAGDLDLLVHHEDIIRAANLLVRIGHDPFYPTATLRESAYLNGLKARARERYLRSHCEHHLVHPGLRLNVDLHWAFSLREFAVSLDPEALWPRAIVQSVAGFKVRTPSPSDMLLILSLNGGKDRWERLDRICDIAALIRHLPEGAWVDIFKLAADAGMARMLAIGVLLAESVLNEPAPDHVMKVVSGDMKAVDIARKMRQQLLSVVAKEISPKPLGFRFDLQMRERWRDRLRYVAAHLRPGVGDWAAVPLPTVLAPLHYVIRPFRLMTRYSLL
jgi:hypothetical protein